MARVYSLLPLLCVFLVLSSCTYPAPFSNSVENAYVEATLYQHDSGLQSTIVTAKQPGLARQAVAQVGGSVTSDLWLIDAVVAQLSSEQITALAKLPGITSVVADKTVQSAEEIVEDSYVWNGWVTDRLVGSSSDVLLSGDVLFEPMPMPNGGLVSLTVTGELAFVNPDGSIYNVIDLPGDGFLDRPNVAPDGTVYVNNDSSVYAVDATGDVLWTQTVADGEKFTGGVAYTTQALFVVDEMQIFYGLDPLTGARLWKSAPVGQTSPFQAGPSVGADGTLYAVNEAGELFAVAPDGTLRWQSSVDRGPYKLSPQVGADGTVYVTGDGFKVSAFAPDGTLRWQFEGNSNVIHAAPHIGPDGSVYLTAGAGVIYGIDPNGQVKFVHEDADHHFYTAPVLSLDGNLLFAVAKERQLLALDAQTGSVVWTHLADGDLLASPVVAANGNLHFGDALGNYYIINPEGLRVYTYSGFESFDSSPAMTTEGASVFQDADRNLVAMSRMRNSWDGRPDVRPTQNPKIWDLVNPIPIDTGADIAHDNGITGAGITVAVVDSGVYFDRFTKTVMGAIVEQNFLGQAEFVGPVNCTTVTPSPCFKDFNGSDDDYGHGSHVAGTIWSNSVDLNTNVKMGVAPDAKILSVRVLDQDGRGSYADTIEGIQYVVANKDLFNVRVMNLSLSAPVSTPYFADPLNRAVEQAWAAGIVVVAAAGNTGGAAQTVQVPGNDPYIITVGAINNNRTPGYWSDDTIPSWSATGPTEDGFVKPDVVTVGTNVVSYMYNDPSNKNRSAKLVRMHPDYAVNTSMFRMNGTSMAAAVASGIVALMLEHNPALTPDQVKDRLVASARPALSAADTPAYSMFQQGLGRIWVPGALWDDAPTQHVNRNMDIHADLAHGWSSEAEMAYHYGGPIERHISDDGKYYLYTATDGTETWGVGAARVNDMQWVDLDVLSAKKVSWNNGEFKPSHGPTQADGRFTWAGGRFTWAGGGGHNTWAVGRFTWAGSRNTWAVGRFTWAGSRSTWSVGRFSWAGSRFIWAEGTGNWEVAQRNSIDVGTPEWIEDGAAMDTLPTRTKSIFIPVVLR